MPTTLEFRAPSRRRPACLIVLGAPSSEDERPARDRGQKRWPGANHHPGPEISGGAYDNPPSPSEYPKTTRTVYHFAANHTVPTANYRTPDLSRRIWVALFAIELLVLCACAAVGLYLAAQGA